ncbi:HesA/MoeB/ThiF family protein [Pseudohongiella sp.]|uniref:THIF-type NAD/FAD binding fold domain-containing protein n=1 Tax=marine sediment metagenome TaxID=412755 RepID=A0A0F9W5C9_9ZZZZ|nr:molybdopterin-synthase adenylyltransferase MoeB [Pseudohongiella sp.]HDZ07617.1 molybdopterin-synthase adenylyltransferase MoeB [Pseudohongiella sp.]HEA63621.1 molybdopterin-synthase adenylyltransferase MoeB [Pseudohongiella sp.]
MRDEQLLRYSRQIMLPAFDIEGQTRLLQSTVLVVGMGGLGSPVAMYLAAAGVGHLILVDDDVVEISNLQRQLVHREHTVGDSKVESARQTLLALNSDVKITTVNQRVDKALLERMISQQVDLVVDACDNFSTRFAANAVCVKYKVPLVSGAAIRLEGQVAVFDSRQPDSPCYQCLYQGGDDEQMSCSRNGVLAPVVGVIGSMQALEAIKILSGMGRSLCGRLLLFDAMTSTWRELRLPRDPACAVCGAEAS